MHQFHYTSINSNACVNFNAHVNINAWVNFIKHASILTHALILTLESISNTSVNSNACVNFNARVNINAWVNLIKQASILTHALISTNKLILTQENLQYIYSNPHIIFYALFYTYKYNLICETYIFLNFNARINFTRKNKDEMWWLSKVSKINMSIQKIRSWAYFNARVR